MYNTKYPEKAAEKTRDPVLSGAVKMLRVYRKATGTMGCLLDRDYNSISGNCDDGSPEKNFFPYCAKCKRIKDPGSKDPLNTSCAALHKNAVKEAFRFKGLHIYACELGFLFWTSPVFSNGQFSGALIGSGFLESGNANISKTLFGIKGDAKKEIADFLSGFPKAEEEYVKALAELLLLCAEQVSEGTSNYHETLKRRAKLRKDITKEIERLKTQYPEGTKPPAYPSEKEHMLLAALRRGDNETGGKILTELLSVLLFSNHNQFKPLQYRAMEFAVLLCRAALIPGKGGNAVFLASHYYLERIQESKTIDEIIDILYLVLERMTRQISLFQGVRHAGALQKAERYIQENYTRKLSLKEIASESGLSAPYFSTIFKQEMGENLSSYLNRLRVEKAARLLTETRLSLSEITSCCGFEDQSWFSKIFKNYTGISPGKYRSRSFGVTDISERNVAAALRKRQKPFPGI